MLKSPTSGITSPRVEVSDMSTTGGSVPLGVIKAATDMAIGY